MQLNNLQPATRRQKSKRVGRGGKRGTTSGHGTKGQKGRAGASVKPGFRGGDNRIWQLFPKSRGASKKHGNKRPHRKHRFFQYRADKAVVLNVSRLNGLADGTEVTPKLLFERGLLQKPTTLVKLLGEGDLKRKLIFKDVQVSKSAAEKITKVGGSVGK